MDSWCRLQSWGRGDACGSWTPRDCTAAAAGEEGKGNQVSPLLLSFALLVNPPGQEHGAACDVLEGQEQEMDLKASRGAWLLLSMLFVTQCPFSFFFFLFSSLKNAFNRC